MKIMKHILLSFTLTLAMAGFTILNAQKINTWKGGFPGQETSWSCPRNWSLGIVPDWASQVVIPQQSSAKKNYPVLSTRNEEIYSLVIHPGARLKIAPGGELTVSSLRPEIAPASTNGGRLVVLGKFESTSDTTLGIAQQ